MHPVTTSGRLDKARTVYHATTDQLVGIVYHIKGDEWAAETFTDEIRCWSEKSGIAWLQEQAER